MSEPSQPVTPLSPEGDSLPMALLAGLVAAAVGAAAWALVTVLTQMQIGWMAVGIGFLVGLAVRKFGKGSAPSFQVLGAVLSLVGCLAGNLLAVCIFAGRSEDVPLMTILAGLTPSLAVYEGYKFARVPDAPSPVVAV